MTANLRQTAEETARLGGKAANLLALSRIPGVTVPPFRVLDTGWFARCARPASGEDPAAARERILALDPGDDFRSHLAAELAALRNPESHFLAVRSSAVGEDSAENSFAGQFDTVLNVPASDAAAVEAAVKRCWASAFGDRVMAYRRRFGLPAPSMAVVLQAMIPAEAAGVCFTANPVTGDTGELVVSATWGLGEGIVSGAYPGDQFTLSRDADIYVAALADKTHRIAALPGGGTREEEVEAPRRSAPCLDEAALLALKRAALAVEERYRCPLDIEFGLLGGRLLILQVRPITLSDPAQRASWGRKILWDNSNIVESYSGLTSPLTFSFISMAYQEVYEQFGRMVGVSRRVHEENQHVMRNYLGLIRGRVYYNLLTWYASLAALPFFRFTGQAMEAMMGVRKGLEVKSLAPRRLGLRAGLALARSAGLCLWHAFRSQSTVEEFQARFAKLHAEYGAIPYDRLPPQRLMALYDEMVLRLLKRWQAPILTDTLAMVFYKALAGLCAKWVAPADPGFQNNLLADQGGVESTEPARRLLECFAGIRSDAWLAGLFAAESPRRLREILADSAHPSAAAFREWLTGYLALYGSRSMCELKLETPTLEEDPTFVFATLKNYFAAPDLALKSLAGSSRLRADAEETVRKALAGHPLRRALFAWVLRGAARHVRNRESMRFARSRVYHLVRRLVLSYGLALAAAGILEAAEDVFYLSIPELQAYAEGRSLTLDLKALAALRKAEYAAFAAAGEPDDRFHTIGLPYHRQAYAAETPLGNATGDVLRGTCCCPGVRRGRVRVIRAPEDDLSLAGEILAAPRTDPGWIPLYPSISALLVEKGSILSHSAIVAREMGIPTVVGIDNLMHRLADGDEVEVDAAAGEVRLLRAATAGAPTGTAASADTPAASAPAETGAADSGVAAGDAEAASSQAAPAVHEKSAGGVP